MDHDGHDGGDEPMDVTMGLIGSLEPSAGDFVCDMLLAELGSTRSYQREKRQAMKRLKVAEIYSPPRVTKELIRSRSRHLAPGLALDLTVVDPYDGQPWDFDKPEKRERARALIRRQKPYVLIGLPMCRAFSTWQYLNRFCCVDPAALERARIQAIVHVDFVMGLYAEQMDGNRYFLHEHPAHATSWKLESVLEILRADNVVRVEADQCQYGAEIKHGPQTGEPIKKPTAFMTNSDEIAACLSQRCTGRGGRCSRPAGGQHQACSGMHAREAAIYPRDLCRAILRGIRAQMRQDGLLKAGCFGVQVADDDDSNLKPLYGPEQGYSGRFRDDLTGQLLKDSLVMATRAK